MLTITRQEDGDWIPCPPGVTNARCYRVIDMGLQPTSFGDKHRVMISWITQHMNPDLNLPHSVHATYTLSGSTRSNLVKMLTAWRGQELPEQFDLAQIVGAPAMLNVVHEPRQEGGVYANIAAVMPGQNAVCPQIPPNVVSYALSFPDQATFDRVANEIGDTFRMKIRDGWARLQQAQSASVTAQVAAVPNSSPLQPGGIASAPVQHPTATAASAALHDDEIPF